ncbi:hypothetical protein CEB3_c10280 [Peptococcaceae bacterium CEB3]|nr:hypothetical protein CEB3_c10280 [Peptococcaceae bacterium CEB3]
MKLILIALAIYMPISFILMILSVLGLIPDIVVVIWYIVLGALIVSGIARILITERLKKSLGGSVLELRGIPTAIKIGYVCLWVAFFLAEYVSTEHFINSVRRLELLSWSGAGIIDVLYLGIFAGRFIMEDGIVYDGTILGWNEIYSYEWKNPSNVMKRIGFSSKLLVRAKKKPELKMNIHDEQLESVGDIFRRKVFNSSV